ncbi:GMC oxidoreductase [Gloeobacter morelensis]|uniref:Cholesterol oxidase n=1 Tax=Gloeobacter morelensis MG652769 TaxID=2781736 RepID=A0ABY3PH50_9CYAN|nr:GMC oxidoreductase [Gloeobacter morelensis]UFP92933.1 GMC family oxidoreductase [Gloeobacter morelensis MG652769]
MIDMRLKRRRLLQAALLASAGARIEPARADAALDAVVIGSGFGGAVAALRLGQAGFSTLVLERGRRWPIAPSQDTFCTYSKPDGRAAWLSPTTLLFEPTAIDVYTGILDVKVGNGIAAFRGAGVGGGSLVYNAVLYQPRRELFYQAFPGSIDYDELDRVYYPRVRSQLKPAPVPADILGTPYYEGTRVFLQQAARAGLSHRLLDIAVDWDIVRQEIQGRRAASTIVGDVFYGINSGAKNSLDRNYLAQAEATGKVEILPLHVVTAVAEAGRGGFQIQCNQIDEAGQVQVRRTFRCRYLFLAAGSIGTTELLLRAKATGTLPRLNQAVGRFWGTNGDTLGTRQGSTPTNPTQGGPATAVIEHLDNPLAPTVLVHTPFYNSPPGALVHTGLQPVKPEGSLSYDAATDTVALHWPTDTATAQRNAQAVQLTYDILDAANKTATTAPADTGITAHPLGGAALDKVCDTDGRVRGYEGLYVVDGALIPGSTACTNPALTIAALAERCLERFLDRRL